MTARSPTSAFQVDLEAVFAEEGDAPVRALAAALAAGEPAADGAATATAGGSGHNEGEDAAALHSALRGVVWTRSMRRMYTLVER